MLYNMLYNLLYNMSVSGQPDTDMSRIIMIAVLRHSMLIAMLRSSNMRAKASRPVTMRVVDYWTRWRHSTFHVTTSISRHRSMFMHS